MANFVSYPNAETLMQGVSDKFKTVEGAYVLRGSVTFANLPSVLTKNMRGYTYNVTDAFTTDSRFIDGGGKQCDAGTNVSVVDVSTYAEVTPVGGENPKAEGWYEYDSVNDEYVLTEDETVDVTKTYYEYVEGYKFDAVGNFVDISAIMAEVDKVLADLGAEEFDETQPYAIGKVVTHERGLYRFTSPHTADDPWDATEVETIDILSLIDEAEPESLTTEQVNNLLALLDA